KKGSWAGTFSSKLSYEDARIIKEKCPSVEYVDPRIVNQGEIKAGTKKRKVPMIFGCGADLPKIMKGYHVEKGVFFSQVDVDMRRKVCILGKNVASKLFGDFSPLGETARINGSQFVVIGVMGEMGASFGVNIDDMIYIPVKTAETLFNTKKIIEIGVSAKSEKMVNQAAKEVKDALVRKRGKEDFRIDTMQESLDMLTSIMNVLTAIIGGIAAISLIVGAIGIMNIMLVSVTERFREIGLRKAVGAKNADIFFQFIVEATLISLIGGVIGIILGQGVSSLAMLIIGLPQIISVWAIIQATLLSITVGIISGVYPALQAARLNPVEALRYE
ncbi:MAG: ABC transporter permease, partial [Candidatus Saganbacteria bacterium]|nr:ABC transporter permease [Candidatus Saganbacteria bacterium]